MGEFNGWTGIGKCFNLYYMVAGLVGEFLELPYTLFVSSLTFTLSTHAGGRIRVGSLSAMAGAARRITF